VHQVVFQAGIDSLRILLGLQLSFIDANQLFPAAGILSKTVVSNPVKPG